jgi:flagellar P-ring protein precursor FlgI
MKMLIALCGLLLVVTTHAQAVRIKDLASFEGVRENQLVGYGLVVGLNGTGDSDQARLQLQSVATMLERMGVTILPVLGFGNLPFPAVTIAPHFYRGVHGSEQ